MLRLIAPIDELGSRSQVNSSLWNEWFSLGPFRRFRCRLKNSIYRFLELTFKARRGRGHGKDKWHVSSKGLWKDMMTHLVVSSCLFKGALTRHDDISCCFKIFQMLFIFPLPWAQLNLQGISINVFHKSAREGGMGEVGPNDDLKWSPQQLFNCFPSLQGLLKVLQI